ncbi:sodium-translocating pyrophosphatase [Acidiluteibacter ferrifornacis]|uniref:Putative K(+)-stimulated pyrophosphate-energized sodium pump n=1 Tax=Acidiluteibacter ferrifornacis TaxID=2692424 RepID=A0A6N9NK00_9FLAO|nr:sodium-translocating pyrophosphatase [Acidiluteibacter ferrifornacis]MBR9831855.1 sodium-translocating pyrophosphatase [bacterium]NBG66194.1 sodium-translocating pyrophosphatase [Acidiluteibacter ferrifornacis]
MGDLLLYLVPLLGILGLIVMAVKSAWVNKQETGDDNMRELAKYIADGAMAFLKAEWKVMAYFVVIAAILLAWSGTMTDPDHPQTHPVIAITFIIGAFLSALAGYLGMNIATKSNVRTTQAARTSLQKALKVSFTGGTVMGLGVAGLAVLGLGGLFIVMLAMFGPEGMMTDKGSYILAIEVLAGFSLGAESIALFARVGGGIYTKAADVGADLVGKVEAGIPEDDVRNPATIADNVGDNVGDVAGMGADLFGSYVATILATMVLGVEIKMTDNFNGMSAILLPMVVAGLGVVFSILGTLFVKIKGEDGNVQGALNMGNWLSMVMVAVSSYFLVDYLLPSTMEIRGEEFTSMQVYFAILTGLVVGAIMSVVTEYYTSMGKKPVNSIVHQSSTGHATNIIGGLSVGMESTVIPILTLAAGIYISFEFAGLYGVAIAASGMMATTAMQLAIDAFGPIADNAGGIAEMSGLPDEVRGRTDNLDAVGNTTAAAGKGFAIASAALTALALFAAFVGLSGIDSIDIYKADVLAGLFVGAMIPFIFSALCIAAVGRAAMDMVNEVRRQFKEIPGIMEYKAKPEYEKCVEISTKASIREMMLPGAIALIVPVIVGFTFGPEVLGGLLAGVTVSGVLMGIFQNNAGGAWDNAKKSFEKGVMINGKMEYKGSDAHKASVTGDTVGDPFKDTSGPSMNILIKLMSIVSLVIAPHIHVGGSAIHADHAPAIEITEAANDITGAFPIVAKKSSIEWEGKKVGGSHNGNVSVLDGQVKLDHGKLVYFDIEIDMQSITNSDISSEEERQKLVGHLKSDDFFGVEEHPNATIRSVTINEISPKNYQVEGELTLKGVSQPITFPVAVNIENGKMIAHADVTVDRTKFGIRYKSKSFDNTLLDKFIYDDFTVKAKIKSALK